MHTMAEMFECGGQQVNGNESWCSIGVSRYRDSNKPVFVTPSSAVRITLLDEREWGRA